VATKKPSIIIEYQGVDITADLMQNRMIERLQVTDYLFDQADNFELVLNNKHNLWNKEWFPKKGSKVKIILGWEGEEHIDFGTFEIDEVEIDKNVSGQRTCEMRGIGVAITKRLRTKFSQTFENKSLREILTLFAIRHNLQLIGVEKIKDIRIKALTQNHESDLAFLSRLAQEYGYIIRIKEPYLYISELFSLEVGQPLLVLPSNQLLTYHFKHVYTKREAEVSYLDPESKEEVKHELTADQVKEEFQSLGGLVSEGLDAVFDDPAFNDVLKDLIKSNKRAKTKEEAERRALGIIKRATRKESDGNISFRGNILAYAGAIIDLQDSGDLGVWSGRKQILSATHSVIRDESYIVECEVKRV
jgi:phage protein D